MRPNNFDIVRLALAFTVVLMHCHDLSRSPSLAPLDYFFNSRLAIEGFFAISGFLIFASYDRSKSLGEYFAKRGRRILPAYWLSAAFCVAIAFAYGSFHVVGFLLANLTLLNFLHPGVPGVFASNPQTAAMNGALWTIKVEVMFYLSVPLLTWLCRRWNRDLVLAACVALSIAYRYLTASHLTLSMQLPGQLSFFAVGALIYYHLPAFKRHGRWFAAGALLAYAVHLWTGWFFLRPFAICILTLGACLLLPHVEGPARWGDFSYGTYVLHFPVVQTLVAHGVFLRHPWLGVAEVLLIVSILAPLSWFFVEKPALHSSWPFSAPKLDRRMPLVSPPVASE